MSVGVLGWAAYDWALKQRNEKTIRMYQMKVEELKRKVEEERDQREQISEDLKQCYRTWPHPRVE